jgi:hypothetical protein
LTYFLYFLPPDVPQDIGNLPGPRARVFEADDEALRQEQLLSQVDLERKQTLLGQKRSRSKVELTYCVLLSTK